MFSANLPINCSVSLFLSNSEIKRIVVLFSKTEKILFQLETDCTFEFCTVHKVRPFLYAVVARIMFSRVDKYKLHIRYKGLQDP